MIKKTMIPYNKIAVRTVVRELAKTLGNHAVDSLRNMNLKDNEKTHNTIQNETNDSVTNPNISEKIKSRTKYKENTQA